MVQPSIWVWQVVVATLALLCSCTVAQQDTSGEAQNATELLPRPVRQFNRAMDLRTNPDASSKDFRHAAALLKAAAGLRLDPPGEAGSRPQRAAALEDFAWDYQGLSFEEEAHPQALMPLAAVYEAGQGVMQQPGIAHQLYRRAAQLGDPDGQAELAFRLSVGLQPSASPGGDLLYSLGKRHAPEALLNYFFAATGNQSFAQMVLGYRHMHGIDVPKSCQAAVLYYGPVAQHVVEAARLPGSLPIVERVRLNAKTLGAHRPTREQEALHFQWLADLGNVDAQRVAGEVFSQAGALRNAGRALRYFRQAAQGGDPDAMAHLGHMYATGVAVEQSNSTALAHFTAAAELGHPSGLYGLGYMHLAGYGVEQDHKQALAYFEEAAKQGHTEAWFHIGVMHLNGWGTQPSRAQALYHFSLAAKMGHVLAMHNLAMLHLRNGSGGGDGVAVGGRGGCELALDLLKRVAERGHIGALVQQGYEAYMAGEHEPALLYYLQAAEAGSELGQSNAAWLLTNGYGPRGPAAAALAMQLYQQAAEQGNNEALLHIGDSFYFGRGIGRDWARSAQAYSEAAKQRNPQAMFNLGFMHQYGAGLPQDLHLAKRFYDRCLSTQPDAVVPVVLALWALWLHRAWGRARPLLPASLATLGSRLFALRPAEQGAVQAWTSSHSPRAMAWLERVLDLAEGLSSTAEALTFLGLVAGLWLVLRRRRALRTAARAGAAVQQAAAPSRRQDTQQPGPQALAGDQQHAAAAQQQPALRLPHGPEQPAGD